MNTDFLNLTQDYRPIAHMQINIQKYVLSTFFLLPLDRILAYVYNNLASVWARSSSGRATGS